MLAASRAMRRAFTHLACPSLVALLAVVAAPPTTAAQTVVGRVVEEGNLMPLTGAFITIESDAGRAGGVLTDGDGRFTLRPPAPGRYRVVAELIGYETVRSDWFELGSGASIERRLEVPVRAISLEGLRVEAGGRCRARPGSGPATARLWEEARKALEVASWGERQRALRFTVTTTRRELDAATLRVTNEEVAERQGFYGESPYQSVPAAQLDEEGYIEDTPDGVLYYAPDAEVLLSESFLSSHCFRVVGSDDDDGMVGLGFEPIPSRAVPDIEGVLWLAESTGRLGILEFHYVNVPRPNEEWEQVGGRVEFERLATGMWIVRRWWIRMPLQARMLGAGGSRPGLQLVSLIENSAEVRQVRTAAGAVIAEDGGASLAGAITLKHDGRPLDGATVHVRPLTRRARTGPDGGYRIDGLRVGRYRIEVRHPLLDVLGVPPLERDITVEADRPISGDIEADLRVPAAGELCARVAGAGVGERVLVYGVVVADTGMPAPAPGAVVRYGAGGAERQVVADAGGVYRLCVEPGARLRLAASVPEARSLPRGALVSTIVVAPDSGLVRADFPLAPGRPLPRLSERTQVNGLLGVVVERGTEVPVPAAAVRLLAPEGEVLVTTVTDASGAFRIIHPGRDRDFRLVVDRAGFRAVERPLRLPPGQEVRLEVQVTPGAP